MEVHFESDHIWITGVPPTLESLLLKPVHINRIGKRGRKIGVSHIRFFWKEGTIIKGLLGGFPAIRTLSEKLSLSPKIILNAPIFRLGKGQLKPMMTLRDYQLDAFNAWRKTMTGTVVFPTGAGKTYVGLYAISTGLRTLVLVPTIDLVYQWASKIQKVYGIIPGILGESRREFRGVTVSTYASAAKLLKNGVRAIRKFSLIVFDECHHAPAETMVFVTNNIPAPFRLGLSATLKRADGNEHVVYYILGNVVYSATYEELARRGYLAPLSIKTIKVPMTTEEYRNYRAEKSVIKKLEVLSLVAAKKAMLERLLASAPNAKCIIYCPTKNAAEQISIYLRRVGYNTELLHGEINKKERKQILSRFKRGESRILVTVNVLDEGVDVPDANMAIMLGGFGSGRQLVQRAGRLARPVKGKKSKMYILVATCKGAKTLDEILNKKRFKEARMILGKI